MSKSEITKEREAKERKALKEKMKQSAPVQLVKGFYNFTEGSALLVTALFAIHQGYYGTYPNWGAYTLMVSGALVLVPAAILLSKFFRAAAQ